MENKYFKPSIEDIKIGYELEFHNFSMDELGISELNYDRWDSTILNKGHVKTFMEYGVGNGVRVSFLTKEQIEAEGWNFTHQYNSTLDFETKDIRNADTSGGFLHYDISTHILEIITKDGGYNSDGPNISRKYKGLCKCINQFRTILKLLNI